jgi:hypothetical protein
VSENSFSHATSEAELRGSKNMKFASIFIKAATRKKRCLRRLQPLGSQRSAARGPKVNIRDLSQI